MAVGYYLTQQKRDFVILDASPGPGEAWRQRWDSLRLFTPARFDGLPGLKFPESGSTFITKDQMADYLELYADHFKLPIHYSTRVERLAKSGDRFVVATRDREYEANNVVVAMSNCQEPWIPAFARELDPAITQIHSKQYRNPSQLRDGAVLVVGAGNSGADIGIELVQGRETYMSGKESGHIPFHIETFVARNFLIRMVRFVGHRVLSVRTPIGRKVRPKLLTKAAPLVRVKPKELVGAGVERVARLVGVSDGLPLLEDGRTLNVANVVWCTGFRPGFSWIDLPILGDRQEPEHEAGVVPDYPGLYFVGLHFLYAMTSETVTGVSRDAKRIAKEIDKRSRQGSKKEGTPAAA
jgi:putative flavoprotein involved in K+ transport